MQVVHLLLVRIYMYDSLALTGAVQFASSFRPARFSHAVGVRRNRAQYSRNTRPTRSNVDDGDNRSRRCKQRKIKRIYTCTTTSKNMLHIFRRVTSQTQQRLHSNHRLPDRRISWFSSTWLSSHENCFRKSCRNSSTSLKPISYLTIK